MTWFQDSDSDTYGGSTSQTACSQPNGFVASSTDCDDNDANIYPGAVETVDDGIDQDCDSGDTCFADADGDGYRPTAQTSVSSADLTCGNDDGEWDSSSDPTGNDCDDTSAAINPLASEVCDGIDNDCDGDIDSDDSNVDPSSGSTFYLDADNDLYGSSNVADETVACSRPSGYRTNNSDCDDSEYDLKPIDLDNDNVTICAGDCNDSDGDTFPKQHPTMVQPV